MTRAVSTIVSGAMPVSVKAHSGVLSSTCFLSSSKPVAYLLDVLAVVEPLGHDDVHPGEEEREVGPGLDRQPVARLARGGREARIDDDDGRPLGDRAREVLHLRVVHVLAEVRADQREAAAVADVEDLGRADRRSERELEADLARAAALRVRRSGDVGRAVREEEVLEERAAVAVREERDLVRSALLLDLQELLGREVERLLPGDLLEGLVAALSRPAQERRLQPVRVVEEARSARAARAEPPLRKRVLGVADDLRDAAVLHVREDAALPEAELAEGRDDRVAVGAGVVDDVAVEPPPLRHEAGSGDGGSEARAADLDELAPRGRHPFSSGAPLQEPSHAQTRRKRDFVKRNVSSRDEMFQAAART